MTKALILAASLGLSVSAAHACDFMHSAKAPAIDKTVVASVTPETAVPMSLPEASKVLPGKVVKPGQPSEPKTE